MFENGLDHVRLNSSSKEVDAAPGIKWRTLQADSIPATQTDGTQAADIDWVSGTRPPAASQGLSRLQKRLWLGGACFIKALVRWIAWELPLSINSSFASQFRGPIMDGSGVLSTFTFD